MNTEDLIKAYNQTHYKVNGFQNPIRIGKVLKELNSYLIQKGVNSWAYITAYNPFSEVLSEEDNEKRNSELLEDIKKDYDYKDGIGVDPKGEWEGEKSFLILGIKKNDAMTLAMKYNQNAIIYGEIGSLAELIITV